VTTLGSFFFVSLCSPFVNHFDKLSASLWVTVLFITQNLPALGRELCTLSAVGRQGNKRQAGLSACLLDPYGQAGWQRQGQPILSNETFNVLLIIPFEPTCGL